MVANRKSGEENKTYEAILDATEAIIREEGYAAVTSRRVAERAGFKSKLVHHHFATMDELFLALFERINRNFYQHQLAALSTTNPLRALWEFSTNRDRTSLAQELVVLSNHRKPMRKFVARYAENHTTLNAAFIARFIEDAGLDQDEYPPIVISYIITAIAHALATEDVLGVTAGHAEVIAFVGRWLKKMEGLRGKAPQRRAPRRRRS